MIAFFKKILSGITKKHFSASIKTETTQKSMIYLLTLMLILGGSTMIKTNIEAALVINSFKFFLTEHLPDFQLSNGEFSCYGRVPFIKKYDDAVIIFDTTGKIPENYLDRYKAGFFCTKSKFIYKKNELETKYYNLSQYKEYNFTKTDVINFINNWKIVGLGFLFILGVCFLLFLKITGVLTLSLIAFVISKISGVKLAFGSLFQISIYAITLPSIIDYCLELFNVNIPYFWVLYYSIAIFYLYRYIKFFNHVESELILSDNSTDNPSPDVA